MSITGQALRGAGVSAERVAVPASFDGHIPCTRGQWQTVLDDAGLAPLWRDLVSSRAALLDVADGKSADVGRKLPRAANRVIATAERMAWNLEGVSWFAPPPASLVTASELQALASSVVRLAQITARGEPEDLQAARDCLGEGERLIALIESEFEVPATEPATTVVAELFGVEPAVIDGLGGLDGAGRLRAHSGLSVDELNGLSRRVLRHLLVDTTAYPPSAASFLTAMLLCERPLFAHIAALHIRELLLETDPTRAADVLTRHMDFLPNTWATHRSTLASLRRRREAELAGDDEEIALAEAELYMQIAEGPVRHTGTTVLRLHGRALDRVPLAAEVHDQLEACGGELCRALAAGIHAEWRNAVAHREVHWDAARGTLVLRGDDVDWRTLRYRSAIGTATCAGFECGVALGRASSPQLASQLRLPAPVDARPQMAISRIASRLGGQGLIADHIGLKGGQLSIRLPDGTIHDAAKVIAELADARLTLKPGTVRLEFGERPACVFGPKALAAISRLSGGSRRAAPAVALWAVIAESRMHDGVPADEIYEEINDRARWNVMRDSAALIGIPTGARAVSWAGALRTAEESLASLQETWRLLPGRVPAGSARLPQLIRETAAVLRVKDPAALERVLRRLRAGMKREGPPDLPWFAPFGPSADHVEAGAPELV